MSEIETGPTKISGIEVLCALPDAGPWKLTYYKPLRTIVAASQISGVYLIEGGFLKKLEMQRPEAKP